MKVHELRTRVRYADTDQMGVVHHAKYLEYFEMGRTEWMRQLGLPYSEVERRGVFLAVVEAYLRYRKEVRFDAEIMIRTWVEKVGGAKVKFCYQICDSEGVAAEGWTVLGSVDREGRPMRMPPWLRKVLEEAVK